MSGPILPLAVATLTLTISGLSTSTKVWESFPELFLSSSSWPGLGVSSSGSLAELFGEDAVANDWNS